ncbi:DMT family transporter [Micromonospora chokoriensis]
MRSRSAVGVALCAAAQVMLGVSVPVTQVLLRYPIFAGQALRYGLAGALLVAVAVAPGGIRRTEQRRATASAISPRKWCWLALLAATGLVGYNACLVVALRHADAATAASIIGAVPIAVALLAPLVNRRLPQPRLILAAAVVVGGTLLVQGAGSASVIGIVASVGALIGDVAFALIAAKLVPSLGPVRVAAFSCVISVPMLVGASVLAGEAASWRIPTRAEGLALAYLGVCLTAVGFLLWFRGLQMAKVERGALTVGLVPLAAAVTWAIHARALPPLPQLLGIGIVVAGLVIGLSSLPRPRPPSASRNGARQVVPLPASGQVRVALHHVQRSTDESGARVMPAASLRRSG